MKRYSRTVAQQCRYYEVNNIFEYMVETYLNGSITIFFNAFDLSHHTRTYFDNSARHVFAVGTEHGCHSDFLS